MIHVEQLTKFYDRFCAVDHINMDIQRGEIVGLLGPNGAGKTTTLRMLTGYFMPTEGTIQVKDLNFKDNLLEIKQHIGYLPESAPLYHNMLVYDYLQFVAKIRGLDKDHKAKRIRTLANQCGLNDIMHKSIHELSKGLKQRVGIAHAMMDDPEILILDEPTSGLDPNQIIEIRDIIKQVGKEKTVILSTHILSEVEATCDRVIIINKGKIVEDASMDALKERAGKENVIYLTLKNASLDVAQKELGAIEGVVSASSDGQAENGLIKLKLECRSARGMRESVYRHVKNTDWILLEFHRKTKNLETIFIERTRDN